ncbi:MFS transporter [Saccharopolyspora phatthalungensis]|uniref:DHA2 family methylenomycin A resistance protein-like MFS transporter n=1 Tax=Saccharopolyspora phatthalungensis TaxID=664693 RepID=A0A840Q6V5_9PSEU|nr:MFS transporter [Saccharopolyspora phatthalungensis]MBB5158242.1 DHA2 family methylenomycin A resistance protein-like MFS transporter [Saccharopolyspora phatthalungensis]
MSVGQARDVVMRRDGGSPALVLAVTCAGMFLVLLDVTVVNVALPSIRDAFGAGMAGTQWVVDGYALSIAGVLLIGGMLGDRFGHRRLVLAGMVLFGAASVGCAVAPGLGVLVVSRAVQGLGAALLLPGSMAVITTVYPDPAARARALGVWAAVSSLALPAGPLLGGVLIEWGGWRLVFALNVPVVIAAVAGIRLLVPDLPGDPGQRVRVGALTGAVLGLTAVVFAVIETGQAGGNAVVLGALVVAVIALGLAGRRVPRTLLANRPFVAANVVALLMNLSVNGTLFVLTLYLQSLGGNTPARTGVLLLPLLVPLVLLAPVAGWMVARFGPRVPMLCGAAIAAAGSVCWGLATPEGRYDAVVPVLVACGVGAGLLTTSVVATAVGALGPQRSGLASGVNNTMRQTGTALGVAVFGTVAGSPAVRGDFVTGLHHVAVVAVLLWLVAIVVSVFARESGGGRCRSAADCTPAAR